MITEVATIQFKCDEPGCRLALVEIKERETAIAGVRERGWHVAYVPGSVNEVRCPLHLPKKDDDR